MTRIKICGIKDPATLDWIDGSVDYAGFVYSRSGGPRSIDPGAADSMASTLSKTIPVLVAHGLAPREIATISRRLNSIRVIQIHDPIHPEAMAYTARLLQEVGLSPAPVALWSSSGWVTHPCSIQESLRMHGVDPEYLLVDRVKGEPPLPPEAVDEAACIARLGVAGGLDPARVCMIKAKPYLVDASSWPESGPGSKDPSKVLELRRSVERCL